MEKTAWHALLLYPTVIKKNKLDLRPLPGLPVVRDLVVDMTEFYAQYEKIKPFLQNDTACRYWRKTSVPRR